MVATPHMLERMFVYFPDRHVDRDPSALRLPYRDVELATEDGLRLHGWFVPREGARVTLLVLHGNAGNIGHRVEWLEMLCRAGANVLILDYRGYARSEG
ncbi:MAG: alpha/beta hydrolase, partial [Acidobacteria bacterium]